MRRYAAAYGLWLLGVISAAAVLWWYYRTYVLPLGDEALAKLGAVPPARVPPDADGGAPAEEDEGV